MNEHEVVQKKIELLTEKLGKDTFLELLHFVYEIMIAQYEIKVFISRRFLDLYMEYKDIVCYLYEEDARQYGRIVTNLSVSMLSREELSQNILIVDDVVLNGMALDEIYRFLCDECGCSPEKISVKVFLNNKDVEKVESKLFLRMEAKEETDEADWLVASSSIVHSFYVSAQPYVSYLPYWEIALEDNTAQKILKKIKERKCESISTKAQKQCGIEAYILFEEQLESRTSDERVGISMVRVYLYREMGRMIVIPYVVLKPIDRAGMQRCCGRFVAKGALKSRGGLSLEKNTAKAEMLFFYTALTYILSYAMGMKFLSLYGIQENGGADRKKEIEAYSFVGVLDVEQMSADDILDVFDEEKETFLSMDSDAVYADGIQDLLDETIKKLPGKKTGNLVNYYLKLSGEKKRNTASDSTSRKMWGIEVRRLAKFLGVRQREIWQAIIEVIDAGRGTIAAAVSCIAGKECVCSMLFSGEMSFSGNEDNLACYVYPLMKLEMYCEERKISSVHDKKAELAKNISDQYGGVLQYHSSDYEVSRLINERIREKHEAYYLWRFPAYERDENLIRSMEIEQLLEKELAM